MNEREIETYLVEKGVRACLVGARALADYGVVRATMDTDYLTTSTIVTDDDFWPAGVEVDLRRGGPGDPVVGVARFRTEAAVDVVVVHGKISRFGVDTAVAVPERVLPVATPLALALMKLEAGGFNDMGDVTHLIEARRMLGDETLRADIESHTQMLSGWGKRAWAMVTKRLDAKERR